MGNAWSDANGAPRSAMHIRKRGRYCLSVVMTGLRESVVGGGSVASGTGRQKARDCRDVANIDDAVAVDVRGGDETRLRARLADRSPCGTEIRAVDEGVLVHVAPETRGDRDHDIRRLRDDAVVHDELRIVGAGFAELRGPAEDVGDGIEGRAGGQVRRRID